MKRKVLSLLIVMLVVTLLATPASAGPGIDLNRLRFSIGSLIADGKLTGLGNTDVTTVLDASGTPVITCINHGRNYVPGQNPPKVSASGNQALPGSDPLRQNGQSPFTVETEDPVISWEEAGCPNANWYVRIDFILWTDATISLIETATLEPLFKKDFTCKTTQFPPEVRCSPVPSVK